MGNRALVIGIAFALPARQLAIFLGSLREHNQVADIVLFTEPTRDERVAHMVLKYGVVAIPFLQGDLLSEQVSQYHPSSVRWILIHAFLGRHLQRYDKVLAVDVRDTVFQGDPFLIIQEPVVYMFLEEKAIEECEHNTAWVQDCFGAEGMRAVGKNIISCSGVVMGTTQRMYEYAGNMTEVLLTPSLAQCERFGVDQGVHNWLLYNNKIAGAVMVPPKHSLVVNMHTARYDLRGTTVHSQGGDLASVAHQYDRNKGLLIQLLKQYTYWDDTTSGACAGYTLVEGFDLFVGVCDMGEVEAIDSDECCHACSDAPGCKAWTLLKGKCWLKNCKRSSGREPMYRVISGHLGHLVE